MFKLFNKKFLSTLMLLSLNTVSSSLMGQDCCCRTPCDRVYIGAFGGELYSADSTEFVQTGTAFFAPEAGGPLAIDARGDSKKKSSGFGGLQIGYEWKGVGCSCWGINPALEVEAFFYKRTHKAHLINSTDTDRLPEHDFANRFPTRTGVYLVNGVLSLNNCGLRNFSPYIGGGIGAAHMRISSATSVQVAPPEVGVNHFDSDRTDRAWALAAQAKAGIRYNFCERFHIFAEYRYVFVDTTRFLFGSTIAPGHAPTSTWDVEMKGHHFNAWTLGLQFDI